MLSVSPITNAGAAASYYSELDDYLKSESAPTAWQGKGAELLGLKGQVESEQFTTLLEGRLPDGTVLGRINSAGEVEHRAGYDLTFSAPKSVSIAGLVAGDERIIAAHERAVSRALAHIESRAATARSKALELEGKALATDNLTFATFRHSTSREQDPQLHTHAVLLNMTRTPEGWKSIESRPIFRMQKEAGEFYRQELARELRAAGYQIKVAEGKEFNFEIGGVPDDLIQHFSQRSQQVEQALAERGKTRESASAAEKEAAALDTRRGKEALDHLELRREWQREAKEHDLERVTAQARGHAPADFQKQEREQAAAAVRQAAEHLSERQARFSREELEAAARTFARGDAGVEAIQHEIRAQEHAGELINRQTRAYDLRTGRKAEVEGFTTAAAVQTERRMLESVKRLSAQVTPIASAQAAQVAIAERQKATGYLFSKEQVEVTTGILTDARRLHLVQGYAGTAKTTSVLAAVTAAATREAYQVQALAPTGAAAQLLGREIDAEAVTIASHLNQQTKSSAKQLWIIDETGMVSAKDMQRLLSKAESSNARVILVGDDQQLGSVEAGRAFGQVQEHLKATGGRAHELSEIVRQRNENLRGAVYSSIAGDAQAALAKIQAGAGKVVEIPAAENTKEAREAARAERVQAIAKDFSSFSPEEREKTLIIAPGRDDRAMINSAVREKLQVQGEIRGQALTALAIESKDLTATQARLSEHYAAGDLLKAHRRYQSLGLEKGQYARVTAVDAERNRITIEAYGKQTEINPGRFTGLSAYYQREIQIAAGDKLIVKSNDVAPGLKNGAELSVVEVKGDRILARSATGKAIELDAAKPLALDYGWALTGQQAQGKTADRVLVHAESKRINLQTQQQLYVAISRARSQALVYTDDRKALVKQIKRESGQKETALPPPSPKPPQLPQPPVPAVKPPAPAIKAAREFSL